MIQLFLYHTQNNKYVKYYFLCMKKLSINLSDSTFNKLKQKSVDESNKTGTFVSMGDLILPDIEKKFGK